jgi:hypothetical protein
MRNGHPHRRCQFRKVGAQRYAERVVTSSVGDDVATSGSSVTRMVIGAASSSVLNSSTRFCCSAASTAMDRNDTDSTRRNNYRLNALIRRAA